VISFLKYKLTSLSLLLLRKPSLPH